MAIQAFAVIGAGTMGNGIAQVAATAGLQVCLIDAQPAQLDRAKSGITKSLAKFVEKGVIPAEQKDQALSRIATATELDAAGAADFAVEAVFEDFSVKSEIFRRLDKICRPEVILASNTSSIAITEMASLVKRPSMFVGMHFFNPVPMMQLVEVIPAMQTGKATTDLALAMAGRLGKTAITCKDTPGFVLNRLLIPYMIDAVRLLEAGVASAEDIDKAMKLGAGFPMGPFELMDFTGVEISYLVGEMFYKYTKEPRFAAPGLLRNMVKAGYLGRKTGKGFYDYSEKK